jgi:hypothetical protein
MPHKISSRLLGCRTLVASFIVVRVLLVLLGSCPFRRRLCLVHERKIVTLYHRFLSSSRSCLR